MARGACLVQATIRSMQRRRKAPTHPPPTKPRRNALALRVLQDQEEERRRIARMLHDDLGQTLTAAVLELEYAKSAPDGAEVIDATLAELRRLLGAARDLSLRLRPALIDEEGLAAALGALASRLSGVRGVQIDLSCRLRHAIPADIGLIAFRIVQDAVAALCAPAARITIALRATPAALELRIGASSRPLDADHGGSISMHDRAVMIGGTLQLRLLRGGGSRVQVSLPLPAPPAERA